MSDSPLTSQFIQAANFTPDANGAVTRVVIHDEEYPERPKAAVDVANFFANQARNNSGSSAHYTVDDTEVVGCVHEKDRAWHAPPNAGSIGIEHSGYSHQTAAEWADAYSEAMLRVSAQLTADLCKRHGLPIVWLSVDDLLNGRKGITSHNNVSLAWHQSSHTDPGPGFPVNHYLDLVRAAAGDIPTPTGDLTMADITAILAKLDDIIAILTTGPANGNPPNDPGVKRIAQSLRTELAALAAKVDKVAIKVGA